MLTRFDDFTTFADELRRRMDRIWDDFDADYVADWAPLSAASWPHLSVFDAGATLVVKADVPGLNEKDLRVELVDGTLTLTGERKAEAPKGYTVHRQERGPLTFSRSLSLPVRVDSEKTTASVKDGVLTITLTKAAEAQPRQITVRAS